MRSAPGKAPGPPLQNILLLSLVFLLGTGARDAGVSSTSGSPSGRPSEFAYTPGAIWRDERIAVRLGLTSGAIYRFEAPPLGRGGDPAAPATARVVGDPARYRARDARISSRGLIAFHGSAPSRGDGIGVLDSKGALLAFVSGGSEFAWSPRGTWLAVTRGGSITTGSPGSILLWNERTRSSRPIHASATRVGWIGEDSLLLQLEDRVLAVDPRSGMKVRTGHHGTVVSADGLYSMRPGGGGRDTQIFENETGRDVTSLVFEPLRRMGLGEIRSAFWVHGGGSDHWMCVSGTDDVYGGRPRSRTAVIDAETGEMIALVPGEAIGPTADGTRTIVLRHESGVFESVDLEAIVRDWIRESGFH